MINFRSEFWSVLYRGILERREIMALKQTGKISET
jgi:hypothetical protein